MTLKIAVSGKGGTGKTTLSGLLIASLIKNGRKPVLAIDADANATLHETLGVSPDTTIGELREHTRRNIDAIPPGVAKETFLELKVQEAVTEGDGFDLLVMGRPEGSGCYCYVNSVLRKYIDLLAGNYPYVVMDNEAGMEHLSRRTSRGADVLLVCSDPTVRGIKTAERIAVLAREEDMNVGRIFLVVGRQPRLPAGAAETAGIALPDRVSEEIRESSLEIIGIIPYDEEIEKTDLSEGSFMNLPDDSPALVAAARILEKIASKQEQQAT